MALRSVYNWIRNHAWHKYCDGSSSHNENQWRYQIVLPKTWFFLWKESSASQLSVFWLQQIPRQTPPFMTKGMRALIWPLQYRVSKVWLVIAYSASVHIVWLIYQVVDSMISIILNLSSDHLYYSHDRIFVIHCSLMRTLIQCFRYMFNEWNIIWCMCQIYL